MKNTNVKDYFAQRIIENPAKAYIEALRKKQCFEHSSGRLLKTKLSEEAAYLGLLLLNDIKFGDEGRFETGFWNLDSSATRYEKLRTIITENLWDDPQYQLLLECFFDNKTTNLFKYAWKNLISTQYTSGYDELPFRNPEDATAVFQKRMELLWGTMLPAACVDEKSYELVYLDLSLEEELIYSSYLHRSRNILIWTAAIDTEFDGFFQIIQEIIHGNHPIGKVNHMIIKALLNSCRDDSRMLLGSLLLAAKREEGLRQTILETAGRGNADTFLFLLKLIEEHELFRFSAFTRALDVWLGMGWDAPKEILVKRILNTVIRYLSDKKSRLEALSGKDNIEVYVALWCYAFEDVNTAEQLLWEYYPIWNEEKKTVGLLFSTDLQRPDFEHQYYSNALFEDSPLILACAVFGHLRVLYSKNIDTAIESCNVMFERYEFLIENFKKEYHYKEVCFPWFEKTYCLADLHKALILLAGKNVAKLDKCMALFPNMTLENRNDLAERLLPGYGIWEDESSRIKLSEKTREYAIHFIQDKGENVHARGVNALLEVKLNSHEIKIFEELLKRKKAKLRKNLLEILVRQNDDIIAEVVASCLESKNKEQRLAALDLIDSMKSSKRMSYEIEKWTSYLKYEEIWSPEESILISNIISQEATEEILSPLNAYGLFKPASISTPKLPEPDLNSDFHINRKLNPYGFSCSMDKLISELERLKALIIKNKDYEYEIVSGLNGSEWILLGNEFKPRNWPHLYSDKEVRFKLYPLHELWDEWYLQSGLKPVDLFICINGIYEEYHYLGAEFAKKFVLQTKILPMVRERNWNDSVIKILTMLSERYPYSGAADFIIQAQTFLYMQIPEEIWQGKGPEMYCQSILSSRGGAGWQFNPAINHFLLIYNNQRLRLEDHQFPALFDILRWRQVKAPAELFIRCSLPLLVVCKAYELKHITREEFIRDLINPDSLQYLTNSSWQKSPRDYHHGENLENIPDLIQVADIITERLLDIELLRGDSETPVTYIAEYIYLVKGSHRMAQIVSGLGSTPLISGMLWSYSGSFTKQQMFSHLLRYSVPTESDTMDEFIFNVKKYKLSEKQLINVALYSPRWRFLIADYLGWEGLESAIWWMHAHTKTSSYQEPDAMLESEVAKYSALDLQEFKSGGVDIDWFISAYTNLGKTRWEIVYDSAKYVSEGNGHRRARLYSDALNAKLNKKEVEEKILQKRDQDYMRVYGLLPLDTGNPVADKLHRYELIQTFKKQSKQFGSQKQSSESIAVDVCMSNLARKAGYADSMRMMWAMETEKVKQIFAGGAKITEENVSAELVISEDGKAELVYTQDGKFVSKIPAKLKKLKDLEVLIQQRKDLREQYSRSRKTLEEMMISKERFDAAELSMLESHPVIRPLLKSLVFVSGDSHGFLQNSALQNPDASSFMLSNRNEIRIAHCADLYENGSWSSYQKFCFENQIVQPFKQIFRELYIPVEDELKSGNFSRRYEGHQIQPAKTVGLLKSRGWKIDYEQGFQKLFPKEGFSARLFAAADWFSPAEVENPTISGVEFVDLKNEQPIKIDELNPIVFSEVMRDVDLVVSVAHAGEVDPQASHSTLEMRNVMVRESVRLFKLKNVEIKKAHAIIQGELGDYTVHLGSGIVHKSPGVYISILAVQSQHRGKVFLPFMDDDPKTAEIISKVLLLAQDNKIKDPTVLEQILKY